MDLLTKKIVQVLGSFHDVLYVVKFLALVSPYLFKIFSSELTHFFLNKRGRFLRHRSQQVFKDQETPRTYRTLEAHTQDYISVYNLGIRWTLCVRKFKWCTAFMRALQWCSCLSHECFCKISVNQCFTKLHLNGIVPVVCHHYPIRKEKAFLYVWEIRRKNYKQPLWCQSDGVEKEWIQRRWRSKPPLILLRNFNRNKKNGWVRMEWSSGRDFQKSFWVLC